MTIQSKEFGDHYEINIIDNGPGFNPDNIKHEDERARIAGHARPILEKEFDYRTKLEYIFRDSLGTGKE